LADNKYFSGIINLTKETIMQQAQLAWSKMNNLKAVTTEDFFKITFGFSYDEGNINHDAHYKNLDTFLKDRVGMDAYVDSKVYSPSMAVIKNKSLKQMNVFDKLFHIWNNNVGRRMKVSGFQELLKKIFECNATNAQITPFLRYVTKFPELGTSEKLKGKGIPLLFSIHQKIPKDLYDDILGDHRKLQKKYRTTSDKKKGKIIDGALKMVQNEKEIPYAIFTEEHFQTIGAETFAKISKEEAIKANELVGRLLTTLKDVKTELAEVLDNTQMLQTKLKIFESGTTTSIADRLKQLEDQI